METVNDLTDWLAARGIDTSAWGTGAAKSVADLWEELRGGDCTLADNPPRREVAVVQITIRRGACVLLEIEQEMENGRFRARNHLPSEKIKTGEALDSAARRCLQEELAVAETAVTWLPHTDPPYQQIADSPSYPGLLTNYTFYPVVAQVTGLPDGPFWRDNLAARTGDPVQRHLWAWRAAV
ncbi:MAG: NUDIX domain-containing protein [Chloroflexi bacterium]|nr:NUDIX domain-containing protein [Chloroflexota bacterium]